MKYPPCVTPWMLDVKRRKIRDSGDRKLTEEQVVQILEAKQSMTILSKLFGISTQAISAIRQGKTYSHVRPDLIRPNLRIRKRIRYLLRD